MQTELYLGMFVQIIISIDFIGHINRFMEIKK
jgi:hypothetical protein